VPTGATKYAGKTFPLPRPIPLRKVQSEDGGVTQEAFLRTIHMDFSSN